MIARFTFRAISFVLLTSTLELYRCFATFRRAPTHSLANHLPESVTSCTRILIISVYEHTIQDEDRTR